jgi:hypothetical protein
MYNDDYGEIRLARFLKQKQPTMGGNYEYYVEKRIYLIFLLFLTLYKY